MQTIDVLKDFKFAENGYDVHEYAAGQRADVSDECAAVALAEKWAKPVGTKRNQPRTE